MRKQSKTSDQPKTEPVIKAYLNSPGCDPPGIGPEDKIYFMSHDEYVKAQAGEIPEKYLVQVGPGKCKGDLIVVHFPPWDRTIDYEQLRKTHKEIYEKALQQNSIRIPVEKSK